MYRFLYILGVTNFITVSEARTNLPRLVKNTSEGMDRVVISVNNKPKAVLMSLDELESLEETAEILSIPGARESIRQGTKEAKAGKGKPLRDLLV